MTIAQLEARVAALEREVRELRATLIKKGRNKDWRSTFGMMPDNEVTRWVDAYVRKLREDDRRRTKPRNGRKTKMKKIVA